MNKKPLPLRVLGVLAVLSAVFFTGAVVLFLGDTFFFGSSKIRPLFGMSADALAGSSAPRVRLRDGGVPDAGRGY